MEKSKQTKRTNKQAKWYLQNSILGIFYYSEYLVVEKNAHFSSQQFHRSMLKESQAGGRLKPMYGPKVDCEQQNTIDLTNGK